jgi:type II restriction enzyme
VQNGLVRTKELVLAEWQKTLFLRNESPETRGWLLDVMKCVESLGKRDFALDEVYAFERHLGGSLSRQPERQAEDTAATSIFARPRVY